MKGTPPPPLPLPQEGNRVLKMVHSKMNQRGNVPYFRCIFQLHFTCET